LEGNNRNSVGRIGDAVETTKVLQAELTGNLVSQQ
jgi:hypothetical protein